MKCFIFLVVISTGFSLSVLAQEDGPVIVPVPRLIQSDDSDSDVIHPIPRQANIENDNQNATAEAQVVIPVPREHQREARQASWQTYAITQLNDRTQYLQSPNFPYGYDSYSQFYLMVTSPANSNVVIACQDFNLEPSDSCVKDSLLFSVNGRTDFGDGQVACGTK